MELRFMKWCDSSEKILQWSSEEVIIPYISPIDNKRHRYFPDFLIQTAKGWFLIEVKPQIESRPPKKKLVEKLNLKKKRRYMKSVRTWLVNEAKWEAAKKVCEVKGLTFEIPKVYEIKERNVSSGLRGIRRSIRDKDFIIPQFKAIKIFAINIVFLSIIQLAFSESLIYTKKKPNLSKEII